MSDNLESLKEAFFDLMCVACVCLAAACVCLGYAAAFIIKG